VNKAQLDQAMDIARSDRDLSNFDDELLHGYGLASFKPVSVCLEAVARMIRWQCIYINGGIDADALDQLVRVFRHHVTIIGSTECSNTNTTVAVINR